MRPNHVDFRRAVFFRRASAVFIFFPPLAPPGERGIQPEAMRHGGAEPHGSAGPLPTAQPSGHLMLTRSPDPAKFVWPIQPVRLGPKDWQSGDLEKVRGFA